MTKPPADLLLKRKKNCYNLNYFAIILSKLIVFTLQWDIWDFGDGNLDKNLHMVFELSRANLFLTEP